MIFPGRSHLLTRDVPIPDEIRADFAEAGRCLDAGCFKASFTMSRRALQRCLAEKGCKKHRLVDAIDEAKASGLLRPVFHAVADEIRQYGNVGAHPDDDQLDNVNRENAEQILEFNRLLIHDLFEVPAAAEKLKSSRVAKKKKK